MKLNDRSDAPSAEAGGFLDNAASRDECKRIPPPAKAGGSPVAWIDRIFSARFSRKGFLKTLGTAAAFLLFSGKAGAKALAKTGKKLPPRTRRQVTTACDIAVAKGKDPALITRKAVEALGGMSRFVHRGDVVVVKPNIGWDRSPEQAANTNPEVVGELVRLCFASGAKAVKVFDNPCAERQRTYANSGIAAAVRKAGGMVYQMSDWKYYPAAMADGALMNEWPLFKDAVECDCFINVPIAKHHSLSKLTLSMKNLMGICGGERGDIHHNIHRKVVELAGFVKPDLTVVDAYRILLNHGPSGGKLAGDVAEKNTLIASADPVLADAYATTLFGLRPEDLEYLPLAARAGLGSMDLKQAKLKEIVV